MNNQNENRDTEQNAERNANRDENRNENQNSGTIGKSVQAESVRDVHFHEHQHGESVGPSGGVSGDKQQVFGRESASGAQHAQQVRTRRRRVGMWLTAGSVGVVVLVTMAFTLLNKEFLYPAVNVGGCASDEQPAAPAALGAQGRDEKTLVNVQSSTERYSVFRSDEERSDWKELGGKAVGQPVAVTDSQCHMTAFAVGTDGTLQFHPNIGLDAPPVEWQSLGGNDLVGTPAVIKNNDGKLVAFVRAQDGSLWETHQDESWSGWSGLEKLPTPPIQDDPAVALDASAQVQVFALAVDGEVRVLSREQAEWSTERVEGDVDSTPAVAKRDKLGTEYLQLYARNSDGNLLQTEETSEGSNKWEQWIDVADSVADDAKQSGLDELPDEIVDPPIAQLNGNGIITVFVRTEEGKVYCKRQTEQREWTPWYSLRGDSVRDLVSATLNGGNRIAVHGINEKGELKTTHQIEGANDGVWTKWCRRIGRPE